MAGNFPRRRGDDAARLAVQGLNPEVKLESLESELDCTSADLESALQELEALAGHNLTPAEAAREAVLRGLIRFYR